MKSITLRIILNVIIAIGIWTFVTNIHESGKDEHILAGIGGVLILGSLLIKDFFAEDYQIKKIWHVISIVLVCIGVFIFINTIHETDWNSKIWVGFGLSIGFLGLTIREIMGNSEKHILLTQKKGVICCIAFIILFSIYGVVKNNLEDMKSMSYDIQNIEDTVENIDEHTKYLNY